MMPADPSPDAAGLSPRVQGNRGAARGGPFLEGSIPAGAGEPTPSPPRSPTRWVYPRGCGGTDEGRFPKGHLHGLSPRVRGNPPARTLAPLPGRSIPAGAGEPWSAARIHVTSRVYPRGCGGTPQAGCLLPPQPGLSPRVRGNRGQGLRPGAARGSIPAGAGEPRGVTPVAGRDGVYPRGCGGTEGPPTSGPRGAGLSPRVRGNPSPQQCGGRKCGSIPAGAGEPVTAGRHVGGHRVYPRGCGGTGREIVRRGEAVGLSPRVRGNRGGLRRASGAQRSIPAGAGEPVP